MDIDREIELLKWQEKRDDFARKARLEALEEMLEDENMPLRAQVQVLIELRKLEKVGIG